MFRRAAAFISSALLARPTAAALLLAASSVLPSVPAKVGAAVGKILDRVPRVILSEARLFIAPTLLSVATMLSLMPILSKPVLVGVRGADVLAFEARECKTAKTGQASFGCLFAKKLSARLESFSDGYGRDALVSVKRDEYQSMAAVGAPPPAVVWSPSYSNPGESVRFIMGAAPDGSRVDGDVLFVLRWGFFLIAVVFRFVIMAVSSAAVNFTERYVLHNREAWNSFRARLERSAITPAAPADQPAPKRPRI